MTTADAWLSTWSATRSHANFVQNAAAVVTPTLLIELSGDQACFPADASDMFATFAAEDKTHVKVQGLHFGQALHRGLPTAIEQAADQIGPWLSERGFA